MASSSFFILPFLQHAKLEEAVPGVTADDITRFGILLSILNLDHLCLGLMMCLT